MARTLAAVVVLAALVCVSGAWAQQQTAQQIDAKLKQLDSKIEELNQLKADLEALKASLEGKPAAPAKAKWYDKITWNGYFQTRYRWLRNSRNDDFFLRRMYINLIAKPNPRTTAVVTYARIGPGWNTVANDTNTDWANIFVDYKMTPQWVVRLGQGPTWFGIEDAQSSSRRIPLERASVFEGTGGVPGVIPNHFGLYFQGPWERGIWFIRNPKKNEPQIILGLNNGQFRGLEIDTTKNFSAHLKWQRPWGRWGVSWLDGQWTNSANGMQTPRDALGFNFRYEPDPVGFQAEYMTGRQFGSDVDGWYCQLEIQPRNHAGRVFFKYENQDFDIEPTPDLACEDYEAWHIGYAYQLDKNNRLTLQYTDAEAGNADADEVGFQWQLGF